VAVAGIDAENPGKTQRQCDLAQQRLFRFIPVFARASVWNCLKMQLFLLHLVAHLNIDEVASQGFFPFHDRLFLQRFERPRCP
jgi:hypothetical protein